MLLDISVSAGDVGAERNVQAGANSDPRGEMRENVYWYLRIFILLNCNIKKTQSGLFCICLLTYSHNNNKIIKEEYIYKLYIFEH